ncbi:hypothetical protein DLAC_02580 [Tieghemostelium lacteum]|uniref:DUF2828 family protein n=1 Tax=Tieghemostelium lacteum TaxID=361077 RepID=A0A152A2Y3_TIELA|nr:hypothetical protein DLAC_02580 [Tieghemostelium lacteum]|eukprot:KYR00564.1 hypothetical protein DLAC_02580 [Tieghemostelium lacteum]
MSAKASTKVGKSKYVHKPKPKVVTNIRKATGTFTSTNDPRVDLFFRTARGVSEEDLEQLLQASWNKSPIDTLRIIFQARDCRGGKGEKLIFHQALKWLNTVAPETVKKNFERVPHFGSWKDVTKFIGTDLEGQSLQLLSKQLLADVDLLKQHGEKAKVSLAGKWAPSENKQNDNESSAAKKLALILCENKLQAKKMYRKNFLTPLRKQINITETLMSSNTWDKINYSTVPSRCMKLQRKAFERHEPALFSAYLESLKKGETKVNAKALFPHEIVKEYIAGHELDTILEEQWKVIENETRKLGVLEDCLVVSDVSGSMSGTPMQVSVALGILIATLTRPPFNNIAITFSENPQFHFIEGATLRDKVQNLMRADWGQATNFNLVFKMILARAQENNLPKEAMPKKMFVISDMQFDSAESGEKNHKDIELQYEKAGYPMPTIIYWNVNGNSDSIPVNNSTFKNVALISGFSPSILKAVLDSGDATKITPAHILEAAINAPRYADLVI